MTKMTERDARITEIASGYIAGSRAERLAEVLDAARESGGLSAECEWDSLVPGSDPARLDAEDWADGAEPWHGFPIAGLAWGDADGEPDGDVLTDGERDDVYRALASAARARWSELREERRDRILDAWRRGALDEIRDEACTVDPAGELRLSAITDALDEPSVGPVARKVAARIEVFRAWNAWESVETGRDHIDAIWRGGGGSVRVRDDRWPADEYIEADEAADTYPLAFDLAVDLAERIDRGERP